VIAYGCTDNYFPLNEKRMNGLIAKKPSRANITNHDPAVSDPAKVGPLISQGKGERVVSWPKFLTTVKNMGEVEPLGRACEHSNQEVSPWRLGFVDPWSCPHNSLSMLSIFSLGQHLNGLESTMYSGPSVLPPSLLSEQLTHLSQKVPNFRLGA
jgi:hypothetical protein